MGRYLRPTARRPARPAAARKLNEAYLTAIAQIAAGPKSSLSHPGPYPNLATFGCRWIKVHRYWFAYVPGPDPVVTNILDEVADIPGRASPDRTPSGMA